MKDEKLEIKKKPQDVKKEDLDKVGGGGDFCNLGTITDTVDCANPFKKSFC